MQATSPFLFGMSIHTRLDTVCMHFKTILYKELKKFNFHGFNSPLSKRFYEISPKKALFLCTSYIFFRFVARVKILNARPGCSCAREVLVSVPNFFFVSNYPVAWAYRYLEGIFLVTIKKLVLILT